MDISKQISISTPVSSVRRRTRAVARSVAAASLTAGAVLLTLSAIGDARADAPTDTLVRQYADPEEFYLFEYADRKQVELDRVQAMRICAASANAETPLEVEYADRELRLDPGACVEVVSHEVEISPLAEPKGSWELSGTIELEDGDK